MKKLLGRTLRDSGGQNLAEYGLALAVIGVVTASAAMSIATLLHPMWVRALQRIILATLGL